MLHRSILSLCLLSALSAQAVHAEPGKRSPAPVHVNGASDPAVGDPREESDFFLVLGELGVFAQLEADGLHPARSARKALLAGAQQARQRVAAEQDRVLRAARERGLSLVERRRFATLVNTIVVRARREHVDALRRLPGVTGVYENRRVHATLGDSVPLIGADRAWALVDPAGHALDGTGTVVAVIDSGIDYTHPDLGGCLGPGCKVIGGWDFVNGDADPKDDHFHGTHVAGIVAANGVRKGVAPGARLLAYKVLGSDGSGSMVDIVAGIEAAMDPDGDPSTDDSADVINLSLGAIGGDPRDPPSMAVDNAVAAGAVVAVAAGNFGDYFTLGSPGMAERAITVASSTKDDAISEFSSRGPVAVERTGFVKPEITAPGSGIDSTVPANGHEVLNGTSMSAPHVAGAAALLRQLHPDYAPDAIKNLLIHTAQSLQADIYIQGAGRLDVARAVFGSRVTVDAGIVNHGWVDADAAQWTSPDRTLTFTNHGDTPITLSIAAEPGTALAGVTWEQPAALELPPHGSGSIVHRLRLDPRQLPFATSAALAHEGALRVTGPGVDLRVPVIFHHAPTLSLALESPDHFGGLAGLYREDGSIRWLYEVPHGRQTPSEIRLPPGRYNVVFAFGNVRYVVKENVDIQQAHQALTIGFDEASHAVRMPDYRRADGSPVPVADLEPLLASVVIEHRPSGMWFEMRGGYVSDAPEMFRFSDVSDQFRIHGMALLEDYGVQGNDRQLYHSAFTFRGMDAGQDLQLGSSDQILRMRYDEASHEHPVLPIVRSVFSDDRVLATSAFNGVLTANRGRGQIFEQPFSLSFHMSGAQARSEAGALRYLSLEYRDPSGASGGGLSSLFQPWSTSATERGFYFLERDPQNPPHFEAELARLRQAGAAPLENAWGQTALAWTPEFYYDLERGAMLQRPAGLDGFHLGALRDAFQNRRFDGDVRYRLFVDDRLVGAGDVLGAQPMPFALLGDSPQLTPTSQVLLVAKARTALHGRIGRSTIRATNLGAGLRGPHVRSLQLLDGDGLPVGRVIATQAAEHRIELIAGDDLGLESVGLELDVGRGWETLPVASTGEIHRAALPALPADAKRAKLRVSLRDRDVPGRGNTLVQVIDPVFVIDAPAKR
jgi:subtilisin family serine protease